MKLVNPFRLSRWGATEGEVAAAMVGDDLIADAPMSATRAITIDAPPDRVFPWLRQMGFGRAGWYSYDWVDNLGRPSARSIHPQWQGLARGDTVPGGPIGFLASTVEPNRAFCVVYENDRVQFTLAFELSPVDERTRLVSRARADIDLPGGALLARWVLEPGDGLMVRRQLLGIKERAEAVAR